MLGRSRKFATIRDMAVMLYKWKIFDKFTYGNIKTLILLAPRKSLSDVIRAMVGLSIEFARIRDLAVMFTKWKIVLRGKYISLMISHDQQRTRPMPNKESVGLRCIRSKPREL